MVTYEGTWSVAKHEYLLKLTQTPNHKEDKSQFVFRMPIVFHRATTPSYSKTVTVEVTGTTTELPMRLPAEPEWVSVNTGSTVLAKVIQTTKNENVLAIQTANDPDPFSRLWASYELLAPLLGGETLSTSSQATLAQVLREDPSPYVRLGVLSAFSHMKSRWLPQNLALSILSLAKEEPSPKRDRNVAYDTDTHGWHQWRSKLLATVGRIDRPEALPLLAGVLGQDGAPLDDLAEAAYAVAALGNEKSADVLKAALKVHEKRGYRFQFAIQIAFGALETPKAAEEIRELANTSGSDLMGRIVWTIADNQTLKNSPEWAQFLKEFLVQNPRFGEDVKARMLGTIEEVKNPAVKEMLQAVLKETQSERLREGAKKILDKNFGV